MGKYIVVRPYDRNNGHFQPVSYAQFYPDDLLRNRRQRSLHARLLRLVDRVPWGVVAVLVGCACWFALIWLVLAIGRAIEGS